MASEWDQFETVSAPPAGEDFGQFDQAQHPALTSQHTLTGGPGDRRNVVFQSLKDYGATPIATAAIMGDIEQESSYKARLPGDRGTSWGLLQVGSPMFRQFEQDQAKQGFSPGSPEYVYNQVPYILDRFKRQHPERWEAMQNAPDSETALNIFRGTKDWGYGIAGNRFKYARTYEEALKGKPVEEVIREVPIEKAIPIKVREVEVRRARPVEGAPPQGYVETGAPAEATPAPAAAQENWDQFEKITPPGEELTPEQQAARAYAQTPEARAELQFPEGSPEAQAIQQARPLLKTQVPAPGARGPTIEESVAAATQVTPAPTVEVPRRGPASTVPEAYEEAGGGIGGVINALHFASQQPIIDEDQAKQIMSVAAGGARTAAKLTGQKDLEQGVEEHLADELSKFTTPEAVAQLAVLKNPVARVMFAGQALSQVPDDITAIAKAYKSGDQKELGRAIAAASVNATMGAAMAAEPIIGPRFARAATETREAPPEAPAAAPEAAPGMVPETARVTTPVEAPAPEEAPPGTVPPAPAAAAGSAWQGVPFMSQQRIKAGLSEMGYSSAQIEGMTRPELRAIDWQAKTRGPGAPEPAGEPTMTPKTPEAEAPAPEPAAAPAEDFGQFEEVGAPTQRIEKPLTPEEIAEREHRAEMIRAGKEAIEEQGGMDILDALAKEGGFPLKGHRFEEGYRGELQMLRETIRGTKGYRYRDVFGTNALQVDQLLNRLRSRGFEIETPHELIDRVQERIRTGTPFYGMSEKGMLLTPKGRKLPRRPGETGPELFGPEEMPFTLRGEELTQEVGKEGAARAQAEAEAQAKKEQGTLFTTQQATLPRKITPTVAPTLRAGEPISEASIRDYLSKALDIPIRAGIKVPGKGVAKALGLYRLKPETIRSKLRNDIPTISHEVGHYLHHLLFTDPNGGPSNFATGFDQELLPLGRVTSRPSYPIDRIRREGVAEFTREWLTDRSQALAKAPNFTNYFERELKNKFPQTWDIMEKARGDVEKFIAQPGWEKARSRIVFDQRQPRGTMRQWLSRKYTEWFNELAPIDRTMKRLQEFGLDKATAERVSERAVNYKGGWRGKADYDLEFAQTDLNGNEIGPGLKKILSGLEPKELGDFSTYIALKRAQEKAGQGIRTGFEEDLKDPEVTKRMADLAPRFEQKRQELINYSQQSLMMLAQAGYFTPKQFAKMLLANRDYVPFYRIYEDARPAGPRGTNKSGGFVNTSSGVLRMKGSDRQIIDPLESVIKNTYAFRDLAERNTIGKEFVDAVEQTQGGGRIGETVLKPVKPSRVSHEELSAHLEKLGLDESDIKSLGPDIGMTLWRATNGIKPSDGVFRVWDKGKERLFQVDDPDLLKALSLADSADAAAIKMLPLFKPFAAVTKMLRTGATLTPEFMARNPFRDQLSATVFSRHGFVPGFDGFRGMLSVLKKDQYYKDWIKSGGRYSGLYDIEGPTMRKTLERVIRDPGAVEQAGLMLRHPLQTLGAVSSAFENATRVGEFRRAIDAGMDPRTAANASKDVTLNFSRSGLKGKVANQVMAFFNAGLQDLDKFVRAHREAPLRTTTKAFLAISVPSIVTWALGKDDPKIQNLPEWRKNFFWNLNVNGTVLSLPKPFLLGALYGTSVEKALDYANGRDPNAVKKALSAIYQAGSPARGDMIAATNAFKPLVENMTNYSFFQGRPLLSESQRQLSPAMQFSPNTSETAKFVGKQLNQSPILIDNLIRGYFGGLGRYATDATDWLMLKAQGQDTPAPPAKSVSQMPLIKGFVQQPYEASAYVQRFYSALDKAETRLNDMRAYGQQLDNAGMRDFLKDNRDQLAWYNAGKGEGTVMTELRKTRDDLSDINKAMVAVQRSRGISPEEKQKRLIQLGETRDKLAEAAFKTYIHPSDRQKVF